MTLTKIEKLVDARAALLAAINTVGALYIEQGMGGPSDAMRAEFLRNVGPLSNVLYGITDELRAMQSSEALS